LWIFSVVLPSDSGFCQEFLPCLGHALRDWCKVNVVGGNEKEDTYREGAGDRIKAYMYLVDKVGRVADTHKRAARVDVILPTVQLLVVLERQVEPLVLRLEKKAIGLEVDPLYVGNISKVDGSRHGAGLEGMKMWLSRDQANCDMGDERIRLTSFLCIDNVCSLSTSHFGRHSQLVAKPSSLMLTIPLRTTWVFMMFSEFRFGDPPIPE
jgi:hypothetical protein